MLTLALECSTSRGSLALAGEDGILWRAEFLAGRGHGGELFLRLEEAMAEAAWAGGRLGRIVVGLGPGSYSGVRQAVAAATGLALATGARLHGRPSTAALATPARAYQAVGDARRGTFYYTAAEDGRCVAGPELLPDLATLQTRLAERPEWPTLAVEASPAGMAADTPVAFPAAERLLGEVFSDEAAAPLEPIYLRPVTVTLPKKL